MGNFQYLAIFGGCTDRFVSHLAGNPENWFSHNEAQMDGISHSSVSLIAFFSSSEIQGFIRCQFLAHLSRRLIGELIVYPWFGVCRRPSVRRTSSVVHNAQTSSSQKPLGRSKPNFMWSPWVGGTKFCLRHLGHMTKMAATPIYGQNPSKIFFSRTGRPIFTKLGM